jgi:hypothetical protein
MLLEILGLDDDGCHTKGITEDCNGTFGMVPAVSAKFCHSHSPKSSGLCAMRRIGLVSICQVNIVCVSLVAVTRQCVGLTLFFRETPDLLCQVPIILHREVALPVRSFLTCCPHTGRGRPIDDPGLC